MNDLSESRRRTSEARFKWTELLIGMVMSAGSSAAAVVWSVAASQTAMQKDIEQLKVVQAGQQTMITSLGIQASTQNTQIAVVDTNYKNIILSLSEIKDEIRKR